MCSDPMGHLQATGIDAAGRKQYLYHQRWRERRDQQKFDEMLDFARVLPRLRRKVGDDLREDEGELTEDAVLACAVRLLDRGMFRIGGEGYAEENSSYGLATLHRSHLTIDDGEASFEYAAKGGIERAQSIGDPDVIPVLARLKRRRSKDPELLAYKEGRIWRDVRSDDINGYIKEAARGEFSAKDFRTWHATVLAALALAAHDPPPSSAAATQARDQRGGEGCCRVPGQHARRRPALLHRPARDRPLPGRRNDLGQRAASGRRSPQRPLPTLAGAGRSAPDRGLSYSASSRSISAASTRSPKTSTAAIFPSLRRQRQAFAESTIIVPRRARTRP